jgi:hypothetical protein
VSAAHFLPAAQCCTATSCRNDITTFCSDSTFFLLGLDRERIPAPKHPISNRLAQVSIEVLLLQFS